MLLLRLVEAVKILDQLITISMVRADHFQKIGLHDNIRVYDHQNLSARFYNPPIEAI